MILDAVQIVLTMLILMAIGYFAAMKGILTPQNAAFVSKLVINIALPPMMLTNMVSYFTRDSFMQAGITLLIPFLTVASSYFLALFVARMMKIPRGRRGVFCSMFAFSNTVFIGLPINQAIFGVKSTPYALLYFAGNTSLFWIMGAGGIRMDGDDTQARFTKESLKKIFSPALIAFLIGVAFVLIGVQLPKFVLDSCKYISNLCTPLSLIYIGYVIYDMGFRNIRLDRAGIVALIGRFAITPLIGYVFVRLLGAQGVMQQVFVLQAAMPVMSQIPILAGAYHSDSRFAATIGTLSTLLSILFIPIYTWLFSLVF